MTHAPQLTRLVRGVTGPGLLLFRDTQTRDREAVTTTSPEQSNKSTPEPLLPRIAAGDRAAVQETISRYSGLVWSLARRMLPKGTDAEDTVQDIFIQLWQQADRFDPSIASETTFIATIARRRIIDKRRKLNSGPDTVSSEAAAPLPADPPEGLDPDTLTLAKRALGAMEQLRPEQRKVIELSVTRDLTHPQIAEVTGMPLGTVKTHARRGLIKLRSIIAGMTNESADLAADNTQGGGI